MIVDRVSGRVSEMGAAQKVEAEQHHVVLGELAQYLDARLLDPERLGKARHQPALRPGRRPFGEAHHHHPLDKLARQRRVGECRRQLLGRDRCQAVDVVPRAQDMLLRGVEEVARRGTEAAVPRLAQHAHRTQPRQRLLRARIKQLHHPILPRDCRSVPAIRAQFPYHLPNVAARPWAGSRLIQQKNNRLAIRRLLQMSGIRKQSWHNPCQVTERLHALVQHTDNRDSIVPVIGLLAQRINHMHSRAVTPGGYFDVQRTQARRQIVMRPRARTIRLFAAISIALQPSRSLW